MTFPNFYYKRTAATAKACYICYKPTVTVLATIDTSDFFYTCPVHLTDRGFATRAPDPEPDVKKDKGAVSAEEIAKVKQEWEEKQRLKKEKEKEKKADGGKKDDTDGERKDAGEEKDVDAQRAKAEGQSRAKDI
ncbi:VPS4-associated protein 1 [Chiua virens]|nr:VPS4-associated protein 1 [Chiua virens]